MIVCYSHHQYAGPNSPDIMTSMMIVVVIINILVPTRLDRQSNFGGNSRAMVFFSKRCDIDVFWTHVYHRYWCNYLDVTTVDDVSRCFRFSQFLHGFHDFSRYFHGLSWFLVGFYGFYFFGVYHRHWCDVFAKLSVLMFLPWPLYAMVTNHRSSEAIFAMYRSSLVATPVISWEFTCRAPQ